MNINARGLIAITVFVLTTSGCEQLFQASFPTKHLSYLEAGISSVGPFEQRPNGDVLLPIRSKHTHSIYYAVESIDGNIITFYAFSQGKSPATYADLGRLYLPTLEKGAYWIKFKDVDGFVVDLGLRKLE
jgi:hypothetical protein